MKKPISPGFTADDFFNGFSPSALKMVGLIVSRTTAGVRSLPQLVFGLCLMSDKCPKHLVEQWWMSCFHQPTSKGGSGVSTRLHCLNKNLTHAKWVPQIKCYPKYGRQPRGRRHHQRPNILPPLTRCDCPGRSGQEVCQKPGGGIISRNSGTLA